MFCRRPAKKSLQYPPLLLSFGLIAWEHVQHFECRCTQQAFPDGGVYPISYIPVNTPDENLKTVVLDGVVELANCQWRLKRVRALETGALHTEYDWVCANEPERPGIEPKPVATTRRTGATALRAGKTLHLLERFEAGLQRAFFRALEELRRIRKPLKHAADKEKSGPESPPASGAQNKDQTPRPETSPMDPSPASEDKSPSSLGLAAAAQPATSRCGSASQPPASSPRSTTRRRNRPGGSDTSGSRRAPTHPVPSPGSGPP